VDSNDLFPPSLFVHADAGQIATHFASIALMQPVALVPGGVVCVPRAGHDLARSGYDACPLEMSVLATTPAWPDPPSLTAGFWFIRAPAHIRAPAGFHGLTQVPGDGFGAWPHPTTTLCLEALPALAPGAAIDLGCGSGLLTQAWAMTMGPVVAVDLDPRAITQARASVAVGRLSHPVAFAQAPFARMLPGSEASVLLANVPPIGHREIAATLNRSARWLLASGVHVAQADDILDGYGRRGFRVLARTAAGPWGCWVLVRD
jgi:ribosomal protein L11 methylase PrmA